MQSTDAWNPYTIHWVCATTNGECCWWSKHLAQGMVGPGIAMHAISKWR